MLFWFLCCSCCALSPSAIFLQDVAVLMALVATVNAPAPWSSNFLATFCSTCGYGAVRRVPSPPVASFWTIGIDSCWWACLVLYCGRVARAVLDLPPMTCLFRLSRSVCPPCAVRSMSHAWEIEPCSAVWAYFVDVFVWLVLRDCWCLRATMEEFAEVTHLLVCLPLLMCLNIFLRV